MRAIGMAGLLALLLGCAATGAAAQPARMVDDFEASWKADRWAFSSGPEFPGAAGAFDRAAGAARHGRYGGRLDFDFARGGRYVAAVCKLDAAPRTAAVRLWLRKPAGVGIVLRVTDETGQTLQRRVWAPEGQWYEATVRLGSWIGHWGGADDGVVHGAPRLLAVLAEHTGPRTGAVLLDDVRLVPGEPGKGEGMESEYVAMRFGAAEGWHASAWGDGGATRLEGGRWSFDFTKGASVLWLVPDDRSLLGTPREIRIRVRGQAPGHRLRLRMATHFMTFEKTLDAPSGDGEIVTAAPPGEGWTWSGGENDGKLHGPLRITGLALERGDRADAGALEMAEIRVKAACEPERACVVVAGLRQDGGAPRFVATVRSMAPQPLDGTVVWHIRTWDGKQVARRSQRVRVPAACEPVETSTPVPGGSHAFLEAEAVLEAPGQMAPPAQAYYVAPVAPRGEPKPDPASPFGMGVYLSRYSGDPDGLRDMDRAAAMAAAVGVKWSREDFGWGRIEPERGRFDWSYYDALAATAKRHGISVYGLLGFWSPWTRPYTEEGIDDYCRYASAVVAHYRGQIDDWEVWNEPNIFFWQGPRDMYAEMLKRAYAAIKAANPSARVLGCSTAGIDYAFIKRTMALGAPFDVLTIHPYRAALDDAAFVADLRKAADLVRLPDGTPRPAWITEMGWANHVPHNSLEQDFQPFTQRQQAELLVRAYVDALASGAAPNISWYDFRNDGTDPIYFEHTMGIVTRDFRPKPAYRAFAVLTGLLEGRRAGEHPDLGPGIVAYRFVADGRPPLLALWALDEAREARISAAGPATVTNVMGETSTLRPRDGAVTIPLAPGRPVFVTMP